MRRGWIVGFFLVLAAVLAVVFGMALKSPSAEIKAQEASLSAVKTASYGSWSSPLSAARLFESADSVGYLSYAENSLYFIERQATADGRNILLKMQQNTQPIPQTPRHMSVRTKVHEYGGMPYLVDNTDIYYSRFSDQKIYRFSADQTTEAITPDGLRYMACEADTLRKQLICVREDHRSVGEAVNTLVAIDMKEGGEGKILFEGTDFVHTPAIAPSRNEIAFITWSHPNMPWDNTELRIARLSADGVVEDVRSISQRYPGNSGGSASIISPQYSDAGVLYFVADWSDWWSLYRLNLEGQPELVLDREIEIQEFVLENESSALISYAHQGQSQLARVDLASGILNNIGSEFSRVGGFARGDGGVYFLASTASSQTQIYHLVNESIEVTYSPGSATILEGYFSNPEAVTFPSENDEPAHGFFYPPQNKDFSGPAGQLPPLIVKVHGGPVGAASTALDLSIQFWTSRGFAVFDINHRGSTGYGRKYRKKLYPNWGLVELEDVAAGVRWLVEQQMVDANKTAIRGGSAGGYTVLASMAFRDIFKAGASYFGISDLEVLARDTHKFESRYLDQLIGPYPEAKAIYRARSPIHRVKDISAPLLLLQGLDDRIVPPNQSRMIFDALKANCVPTAYLAFEGEGHGFRKPANNIRALNAELSFYGQIFDFKPAGSIEALSLVRCP